jgi:hypothetical protein
LITNCGDEYESRGGFRLSGLINKLDGNHAFAQVLGELIVRENLFEDKNLTNDNLELNYPLFMTAPPGLDAIYESVRSIRS